MVLNTGILMYPLLFGLAGTFKKGTVMEKIGMLWMALFPSLLFIALVPILGGSEIYAAYAGESIVVIIYLFMTITLGGLFIYFIETAWNRVQVREQLGISRLNFQWETDKLQQITNVLPLNIMSLSDNGVVTGLNALMLELINKHYPHLTKEDILSQPVEQFFSRSLDEQACIRIEDNIRNKRICSERMSYESRTYNIYTAPLLQRLAELPGEIVLIVQDTTEDDKIRSELDNVERLTLVGQMAAGITHEIRNPMAVVRGFLQLMREKSPGELDSYYQIVMEELDRANSIINDFLSLAQSRISDKEQVFLQHIIEDLSPLLWADANLRGQSVELKLHPSLPLLQLNVREIKQLILNLVRNGMEAMGSKGVLTLETRRTQDRVELIVRDTGTGIPEGQREQLFAPFFTTKSQGTGLGLSLCLSIVERHNGTITVDSKEGAGTAFIISFPYEQEEIPGFAIAE